MFHRLSKKSSDYATPKHAKLMISQYTVRQIPWISMIRRMRKTQTVNVRPYAVFFLMATGLRSIVPGCTSISNTIDCMQVLAKMNRRIVVQRRVLGNVQLLCQNWPGNLMLQGMAVGG